MVGIFLVVAGIDDSREHEIEFEANVSICEIVVIHGEHEAL